MTTDLLTGPPTTGPTPSHCPGVVLLWGCVEVPSGTTEAAAVRMSDSDDREALNQMRKTLARASGGSAIGRALSRMQSCVTENSEAGAEHRLELGLRDVYLDQLDARAKHRLLAYVGLVDGVLIMLIPSTGVEADLPAFVGDRLGDGRNAAAELVREAVKRLPNLERLAVPRVERLLRGGRWQGAILDDLRQANVLLVTAGDERNLRRSGDYTVTAIQGTVDGDLDAVKLKANTLGGRVGALLPDENGYSKRDTNYSQLPWGYAPDVRALDNGVVAPIKGSVVLAPDMAPLIRLAWTMFADGATLTAIATELAHRGLKTRDGSGRSLLDMTVSNRHTAIKKMLDRRGLDLYRDGNWHKVRSTSAALDSAGGVALQKRPDGRHGAAIVGRLPVHLVEGEPWGVPADVWRRAEARLEAAVKATPRDHGIRHGAMPLSSTVPQYRCGEWMRLVPVHSTMQLRAVLGSASQRPAWKPEDSRLVAACNTRLLLQGLGRSLMIELGAASAGVRAATVHGAASSPAVSALRDEEAELRARVVTVREDAATAGELAKVAIRAGSSRSAATHLTEQDALLLQADELERHLTATRARLLEAEERGVSQTADLRVPLGLAAAMIRWDGTPNPMLRAALRSLDITESMQAQYEPGSDTLQVSTDCSIELDDRTRATLHLTATVPNTSTIAKASNGQADAQLVQGWAAGSSFAELGAARAVSETWARRRVYAWLARHGVVANRTALVDCPIRETRASVVAAVDPSLAAAPVDLSDATRAALIAPYLTEGAGNARSWAAYRHAPDRQVVQVLELAGGEVDVAVLEDVTSHRVTVEAPYGGRPALATRPSHARRRLRPCPHADCPSLWATHVLYTPETAATALLCRACRRQPDLALAEVVYPEDYLQTWDRATNHGALFSALEPPAALGGDRLAGASALVRPTAASQLLGITVSRWGELYKAGRLPEPETWAGTELWRRDDLQVAERQTGPSTEDHTAEWLSVRQVAHLLGVADHHVRSYCGDGLLPYRRQAMYGQQVRLVHRDAVARFQAPEGDLIRSRSIEKAAADLGTTAYVLRAAIAAGQLRAVRTHGGLARLLEEDVQTWWRGLPDRRRTTVPAARAGRAAKGLLSTSAAAARLGLSPKQLRRLADAGLVSCERPGTQRWFDPDELDRYQLTMPHPPAC